MTEESILKLAYDENYIQVQKLIDTTNVDLAIMGFSSKQLFLLKGATDSSCIKENYNSLSENDKERVKTLEKWIWKCVAKGACLLWGIQQPKQIQLPRQVRFYQVIWAGDIPLQRRN